LIRDLISGVVEAATAPRGDDENQNQQPPSSPPHQETEGPKVDDVERQQPAAAAKSATAATPVAGGAGDGAPQERQGGTYPICYSPMYYWTRFVVGLAFTILNGVYLGEYYEYCRATPTFSPGNIWYVLLTIFWAIQGLFHGVFIVHRFINKTPVGPTLYDGPFERCMKIPLTLDLVAVIAMCIWGFVLVNQTPGPCDGNFDNSFMIKSIIYLIISVGLIGRMHGLKRRRRN